MSRAITLLATTLLLMSPIVRASTDPSPPAPPPAPPPPRNILEIYELMLELGFEGGYDRRHTAFDQAGLLSRRYRQTNTDWRLEETLEVSAAGAAFGENVLHWDIAVLGGLTQEGYRERRPGRDISDHPDGSIFEYDARATLFPQGRLRADFYASREDTRLPRAFQPSLDRSYERYGADVVFGHHVLPMRLSYEHTWDALTSGSDALYDDERRGRDRLSYEATWHINPDQELRFDYEYDDRLERYSGLRQEFSTSRNYTRLSHNWRFGDDRRSSWRTELRWQDESGDLERDIGELNSRLRLQHTEDFSTQYAFQFLRDTFETIEATTHRGEIGLTHQLDDRLTTTLEFYGLRQSVEHDADLAEFGGIFNTQYRQQNNWGEFSARFGYTGSVSDFDDDERSGVIVAEAVTLRDPVASYLAQRYVRQTSLIITDATRRRIYLPIRDYVVQQFGAYTAIVRTPTSAITNGETVYATYVFDTYRDYRLDRHRFDWRVQQSFENGITPYYAGSYQDEELSNERFQRFLPRDVQRHRIGVSWRRPQWSAAAEYEYNDDSIDPYQAIHTRGDMILYRDAQWHVDTRASISRFWFRGDRELEQRNTTFVDAGMTLRYLLTDRVEARSAVLYRYEDDTIYGDTHGLDITSSFEVQVGYFDLLFEAEYDVLDIRDARDEALVFWLKAKREIPIISRRG